MTPADRKLLRDLRSVIRRLYRRSEAELESHNSWASAAWYASMAKLYAQPAAEMGSKETKRKNASIRERRRNP